MTTIDMIFSNKTKISLAEYLSLNAQERDNISNVDIIPPPVRRFFLWRYGSNL